MPGTLKSYAIDPATEDGSHHRHFAPEIGGKNGFRYEGMDAAHNVNDLRDAEAHSDAAQCVV